MQPSLAGLSLCKEVQEACAKHRQVAMKLDRLEILALLLLASLSVSILHLLLQLAIQASCLAQCAESSFPCRRPGRRWIRFSWRRTTSQRGSILSCSTRAAPLKPSHLHLKRLPSSLPRSSASQVTPDAGLHICAAHCCLTVVEQAGSLWFSEVFERLLDHEASPSFELYEISEDLFCQVPD